MCMDKIEKWHILDCICRFNFNVLIGEHNLRYFLHSMSYDQNASHNFRIERRNNSNRRDSMSKKSQKTTM